MKLRPLLPKVWILAPSGGRHLDFRPAPYLPSVFPEEARNPLFGNKKINAAPLWKLRHPLSGRVDLALPGGRRLNFRTVPPLTSVFPDEGTSPLLKTHQITAAHLGGLRTLLSESADLALPGGRNLDFLTMTRLSAVFSEEDRNRLETN